MLNYEEIFDANTNEMTDAVRYFVEKKSAALRLLVSKETDAVAKDSRWYRNVAVELNQIRAILPHFTDAEIRKRPLCKEAIIVILDHFENYVRQVEDVIFDGIFSANEIEKKIQLVLFSEDLNTKQSENVEVLHNSPFRDTIVDAFNKVGMQNLANKIAAGQQSSHNTDFFAEKKNYYLAVFDEMSETITSLRGNLKKMQREVSGNERISSLLERYEKCEQEISTIRSVVQGF